MARENMNDLVSFVAVARERSFTRAAAKLGVSQSALSHTVRLLEARLGIRLLTRTTRSVSLTEAGERMMRNVGPRLDEIETEIATLSEFRDKPQGTVRITAGEHAARTLIWPRLVRLLPTYPDVSVELSIDHGLTDIVAERYDAGVRFGEQVAKDMVSVRVGPDLRFVVVAAPGYMAGRPVPQDPQELLGHSCINLRLPTFGGLYSWEFARDGREVNVRVEGQVVFNNIFQVLDAAVAGFGLAYVPEDIARPRLDDGSLVSMLDDWCPSWTGYHLYYPSRQSSPAFSLVVEALRHRP